MDNERISNDPRPAMELMASITGGRYLYNTNDHPVDVMLDLECISIETGPPLTDHRTVTNTAAVATTSPDREAHASS